MTNKEYMKEVKTSLQKMNALTPKCGALQDDNRMVKFKHIVVIEEMTKINKGIKKSLSDIRKISDMLTNDSSVIDKKIEVMARALAFNGLEMTDEKIREGIESKKNQFIDELNRLSDELREIDLSEEIKAYSDVREEWYRITATKDLIFKAVNYSNKPMDEKAIKDYEKEIQLFFGAMGYELNGIGLKWFMNHFNTRKFRADIATDTRKSEVALLNELTGILNHIWLSEMNSDERKALANKVSASLGDLATQAVISIEDTRDLVKEVKDWLK